MYKEKYFKRLIKLLAKKFYCSSRMIITDDYFELKINFNDGKEENWICRINDGMPNIETVYFSVLNEFENRE